MLAINALQQKQGVVGRHSFKEIAQKYLDNDDHNLVDASIPQGLGFVVVLMRELSSLAQSGPILMTFMQQLLHAFKRVDAGSFFKT
jgi:hypothetical protein